MSQCGKPLNIRLTFLNLGLRMHDLLLYCGKKDSVALSMLVLGGEGKALNNLGHSMLTPSAVASPFVSFSCSALTYIPRCTTDKYQFTADSWRLVKV